MRRAINNTQVLNCLIGVSDKVAIHIDRTVTGGTLLSSENYLYDGSDRLIRVVETDGDNVVLHDFSWTYDAKDNVTALTESIGGKSFSYTYAYDDDSRPTTFGYGDVTEQITYYGHGRSSGTTVKNGSRTVLGTGYAYRDVDSTYTTTQVKSVTNSYGGKTANFNYTYDANGNILSVSGAQAVTYEYDDLGQLVWEKNATAGKAWNYAYDDGGNILSRTEYTCSTNGTVSGSGTTTSYTYGDAEWGDLLTAYNGEEITYDGIGNPLSYRGWTMSWQGGRQLASMTKSSDTLSFVYNESGLRTSKTVNGITHSYVWQGSKLAADITDAYTLYFHYDSSGEVIGFTRTANGADTEYFYVKNLQGDILKVITATGTEAATYTYDAWGKLLTSTGDMAEANPIRYRGYYYDTETELYYLQSRYYDPEVSRFINPDAFATTDVDGVLSANMFAYCENNPIRNSDSSGALFGLDAASVIIGAATGAITSLIGGIAAGDTGLELLGDVGIGALSGAVGGVIGSAITATYDTYKCYKEGVSIKGCAIVFVSELVSSLVVGVKFPSGFFGKGIWDKLGKAAFDLSVGFAVNLTASQISTNVAENLYMTEPSLEDKTSKQPVGNLAYIEPLQVMHYGGGTWRMATR